MIVNQFCPLRLAGMDATAGSQMIDIMELNRHQSFSSDPDIGV